MSYVARRGETLKRLSSADWGRYFERNAVAPRRIPWEQGARLSGAERLAIARAMQLFQLGETGRGRDLLAMATKHADRIADDRYVPTLKLFLTEEHRHADELGRFLDDTGIPRLKRAWPSRTFRWLRKRAGLELMTVVLATAETIAMVFYAALRDATGCPVLGGLCRAILRDERAHVRFQSQRLAELRARRGRVATAITRQFDELLLLASCWIVWRTCNATLRAGGLSRASFFCAVRRHFRLAVNLRDPRRYRGLRIYKAARGQNGRGWLRPDCA